MVSRCLRTLMPLPCLICGCVGADWSGAQVPLIAKFNDLLPSLGMYHTGLELQGREYAYGKHS